MYDQNAKSNTVQSPFVGIQDKPEISEIRNHLNYQNDLISSLESSVAALFQKVSLVLSESTPNTTESADKKSSRSPLAGELGANNNRINVLNANILELLSRIQL